jgi:hypothetical protein
VLPGYLADLKPLVGKVVNSGLNEWTLSLQDASNATIHVQTDDGTDIPGATVSLTCTDTTHASSFTTTKTTDVNGDAYYPNLWEIKNAGFSYLAKAILPGDSSGSVLTSTFPMPSGGLNQVCVISTGPWIDVHVTDQAAGWDVVGGTVTFTNPDGSAGNQVDTTDALGHAIFYNLVAGQRYTFTATKIYTTAPVNRTGTASKTLVPGANTVLIQTNRN